MTKQLKQSEKLDLILRALYEHKDDGKYWHINEILKPLGLQSNFDELWRLAQRLHDDNYVEEPISQITDVACKITSYGIEYCEESSYTYTGQSIITNNYNISIEASKNVSVIGNLETVSIPQSSRPSTSDNVDVAKIPFSVFYQSLTFSQIWKIIVGFISLVIAVFTLGYNIQQWKLERENKNQSLQIQTQSKQIESLSAQKDSLDRLVRQPMRANRK